MVRIGILKHHGLRAIGRDTNDAIADDAGDPDAAFGIHGQAVRKGASAKGRDKLFGAKAAVRDYAKPRQPARKRFVDVKPLPRSVERDLVGITEPIGDDARAALVKQNDKAVGHAGAIAERTRLQAGAYGKPDAPARVFEHKIRRRQWDAVHAFEQRRHPAVARQVEQSARLLAQVGKQEGAVAPQRDAVGSHGAAVRRHAAIKSLRAIGTDMRHTAAPVGAEYIAARGAQHTLGTVQSAAAKAHIVQADRPVLRRLRVHCCGQQHPRSKEMP